MLSPFSSALAKLDVSLQTIQSQMERLRADLDGDGDQLRHSLADACHYTTILSELITAQRSTANEIDHAPLDQLIHELNQLQRSQRRRLKLLNLASELSAGRVHHHRVNRTQGLNELRVQAVRELRAATVYYEGKDLPGPRSSKWLPWACGLQEESDGSTLQALRQDFPALEEFVAAMDEHNWISGDNRSIELSSAIAEGTAEEYALEPEGPPAREPDGAAPVDHDRTARNLLAMFEKVLQDGGAQTLSRPKQTQPAASTPAAKKSEAEGAAKWVGPTGNGDRPSVQPRLKLDKERIDKTAGLEFMKVVNAWQLDDGQARRLLGISRSLFNQMRDGERVTLEPDKLTRISLLVAISKGLTVLYGTRRGDKWVHRPNSNPLFDGTEPLKYMLKEGIDGLVKVRELVGVWSGYVSPEESQ